MELKQMRRAPVSVISGLALAYIGATTIAYAGNDIKVELDGKSVQFPDEKPYISQDNRTMVPVRFVSQDLGYAVYWDEKRQLVSIENSGRTIVVPIGSKVIQVNGSSVTIDTEAKIVNGRTFVPIRFISQSYGSNVTYNEATRTVEVIRPKTETSYPVRYVDAGNERLNVRSGPSTSYTVIEKFEKGQAVEVVDSKGEWRKVVSGSTTGYVHGDFLKESSAAPVFYLVQKGDYLYKIAQKFRINYMDIVKWNGMESEKEMLRTDQKLYVSKPAEVTPEKPPVIEEPVVTGSVYDDLIYTVKSGDSLYKVAENHNISVARLKEKNNLISNIIYTGQKLKVSPSQFMHPAQGVYTSGFGPRWGTTHSGLDIAKSGSTVAINASMSGVVSRSYTSSSYGEVVFIVHTYNGKTYETVYAHMRNRAVKEGEKVSQGTFLGYMGNTGNSTGQHLHFEIHEGRWNMNKSNAVDPKKYLE